MVGERVKHARVFHGWSQGDLGGLVGKSQVAISKIEKGEIAPPQMIEAIAEATGFSVEFFNRGDMPDLPLGSLRFRKRSTASKRDDERVRAHVRQAIELLNSLEVEEDLPPVRFRAVSADADVDDEYIENLAVQAREWLGVGPNDPIPNLTRAVERAGIAVIGFSHEIEKHDGVSYWIDYPRSRPIICLSRSQPGDKKRLSLSHELGHLLLHQLRDVGEERSESEAFRFGAALLLPREAALEQIEAPVTLRELAIVKARFGISIAALVKRCLDLGLVSAQRRVSLEKQISARGWRKAEPVNVAPESPKLIGEAIQIAFGTNQPAKLGKLGLPTLAIRDMVA